LISDVLDFVCVYVHAFPSFHLSVCVRGRGICAWCVIIFASVSVQDVSWICVCVYVCEGICFVVVVLLHNFSSAGCSKSTNSPNFPIVQVINLQSPSYSFRHTGGDQWLWVCDR
jgi:hypothetical protein